MTRSVLVIVLALAIACARPGDPIEGAAELGIDPAVVVDIGSAALAPMVGSDGRVAIVAIREQDGEWVASQITASPGQTGTDSLHLFTYGGATGEEWNSFVFGTAAPGTERVEVSDFPDQRGGKVVGGAWIIALREKDLQPADLHWRFIANDGSVRTGVGIFPPDA